MKVVVFGPERRIGCWVGEKIVDLNSAARSLLSDRMGADQADAEAARLAPPTDLIALIEAGDEALAFGREVADWALKQGDPAFLHMADDTTLHAPWPGRRIICAGANYVEHLVDSFANMGRTMNSVEVLALMHRVGPGGFWKSPHYVMGDGEDVVIPRRTKRFDFEAELVVVIGKVLKDVPPENVPAHIWGVTLGNDWSDRDAQFNVSKEFPPYMSLNLGKNFDCSTSLGPCIVTYERDPEKYRIRLEVNGKLRQDFIAGEQIFSFSEFISFVSRDLTLLPGDVIFGGTGAGTAVDQSPFDVNMDQSLELFLKPGDQVVISSEGIGKLRNRVVAPTN